MSNDNVDKTVIMHIDTDMLNPKKDSGGDEKGCLVVLYGTDIGSRFGLKEDYSDVGRGEDCTMTLLEEGISRKHASISKNEGQFWIEDLGSTNGTFVNDKVITKKALKDGDHIQIGGMIFKYMSGLNVESRYHEEIYRLTSVDGLTQAYNRRYLTDVLMREINRCQRYKRPLSLIMFDIDKFKIFNDTYGHLAGDFVLKSVSSLVQKHVRTDDTFARYGGEEFCIVLPETPLSVAGQVAEKLRELVADSVCHFRALDLKVTVSIGVFQYNPDTGAISVDDFIGKVDKLLYKAKSEGRNCVRL